MSIIGASMVPHPPLILPEVGRGGEKIIEKTTKSYDKVGELIKKLEPETIVITTPHSVLYQDYFHISPGKSATGDFSNFGAGNLKFEVEYDREFVKILCKKADDTSFPAGTLGERDSNLDHASMVPIYFINKYSHKPYKIVRIGLSGFPLSFHYRLGMMIQEVSEKLNRKTFFIASGDLSHKLKESGPYGLSEEGVLYDEKIMEVMGKSDFMELFNFSEVFLEQAAECGHRSFTIMAGALDGLSLKTEKLSHETITGVGYGICTYIPTGKDDKRKFLDIYEKNEKEKLIQKRKNEDPYISLARKTIESYVKFGRLPEIDRKSLPKEMNENRAGTFVSIHKEGNLRGCIGTISAVRDSITDEIMQNAISASTEDPRFNPITQDEFDKLEISVDVLKSAEDIHSISKLDPKKYGVIVYKGTRRGLLLPNLDGIETPEEQIKIARQKAGISENEDVKLQRFEVIRHE